ncbi:hypothetical protein CA13_46990 [Planctomycetes bacterium CA13]|uniref:Uncharacterized protein n=1 Tax=Novipirellula herctigrandis TaxID=2527986 RepID=A0A5C5Z7F5_9BACT|nr:hypothetical protein CA13_46990 [Planctomycetes bacterium CA13]
MFVLLIASVEFGRGMMAVQVLEEAARCGCRIAVLKNSSSEDVESEIDQLVHSAGIETFTTQIEPMDLDSAIQWSPVTVRISADFSDMSWLPMSHFLSGYSYTASCILPREGDLEK